MSHYRTNYGYEVADMKERGRRWAKPLSDKQLVRIYIERVLSPEADPGDIDPEVSEGMREVAEKRGLWGEIIAELARRRLELSE